MSVTNNNSNDTKAVLEWYRTKWGLTMISVFTLLAIFFAIMMFNFYKIIRESSTSVDQADFGQAVDDNSLPNSSIRQLVERLDRPTYGNPDAKIILVEFADFNCPICVREFPIIREVIERYKNDILFVFRQYPVIDEGSLAIGQAALCAGDQMRFWEFHDKVFANPNTIFNLDDLRSMAGELGLDDQAFVTCLGEDKYKQSLVEDTTTALKLGLRGTPTFFLNGNKVEGAISLEQWSKIIENAKLFLDSED